MNPVLITILFFCLFQIKTIVYSQKNDNNFAFHSMQTSTDNNQKSVKDLIEQSKNEFTNGKYQEALGSSLKALSVADSAQNPENIAIALLQVGTMYYYNHESYADVLDFFYKARSFIYKHQIDSLKTKVNYNIGTIYVETEKPDSALYYLNKVIETKNSTTNYSLISKTYSVLAELNFRNKEDLNKSLKYINEAEKYALFSKDSSIYAFARLKRGNYCLFTKNYEAALKYYEEVKKIYEEKNDVENRMYIYKLILNAKACIYNPDILDIFYQFLNIQDSLFKAESRKKTAEYKAMYETEKKENENKILLHENELKQAKLNKRNIIILTLGILILLIITFVLWRLNVINLKKKEQELTAAKKIQDEKERLSRDLHDNIGSLVSFISTKVDWITKNRTIDLDLVEDLSLVKANAKNLIDGLRETLWTLNSQKITNYELVDKLKPYIQSNLLIPYHINDELENENILDSELVLNVYRSCQEIINNINKHSQARQVNISFSNQNNSLLSINIYDNGIGISEEDEKKENHYGLRNLKARLNNDHIEFKINSKPNEGTNISIIIN